MAQASPADAGAATGRLGIGCRTAGVALAHRVAAAAGLPLALAVHRGADLDDGAVGVAADADAGEAGTDALPVDEPLVERRIGRAGTATTSHANDCEREPAEHRAAHHRDTADDEQEQVAAGP